VESLLVEFLTAYTSLGARFLVLWFVI